MVRVQLLDAQWPGWSGELDRIGMALRPAHTATLFPYHFLQVTLPRIGGAVAWVLEGGSRIGAAFFFPRQRQQGGRHVYTLRYHALPGRATPPDEELARAAAEALGGSPAIVYHPQQAQYHFATHQWIAGVDIGRPDAQEAAAVPALHQRIWGSPPEYLYPADVYGIDFAAGTALVARVAEGESLTCAGFLLGFYKFGGPPLPADWDERFGGDYRLESQIMGVLPAYRGLRIANLLKKAQAEQAWREGIGLVNWTADPLQYANAALNFGLLRAVAFDFSSDLYPFRNDLNRVPASRFGLTWLVGSERVRNAPAVGSRAAVLDLAQRPGIARVEGGGAAQPLTEGRPIVAIEIPANWTTLQQEETAAAQRWREQTDALFARYIGLEQGQYCITGVGVAGERRYLIAERSGDALWAQLAG